MFVILHWNSTYTIRDSKAFLFDIQTKYCHYSDSMKCYQIPSLLYGWQLPSPVSPRSKSTRDPALPSRSPLKHSRVSAAARLISSSRIQWPFLTAWANVPYSGAHRGQSWGIQSSAFTHRYMDCFGIVEAEGEYFLGLYLHKGKDHGSLTGSDLLLGLAQLGSQRLPLLLQQGSCTTA